MPDLNFKVESVEAIAYSVSPLLNFKVSVTNADAAEAIQSVMLRCQIQIETTRRQYNPDEQAKLLDLYGEPSRWGQTLKTLLWTHSNVVVQQFTGSTVIDLPVVCTFDFNVATTKYFNGLEGGEIPLCLLFSGTAFYYDENGALQVGQISWEKEANYRLPIGVWKQMMDMYYPNSVWLNIRRDVFENLQDFKMRQSIPSWEQALESLLPADDDILADTVITGGGAN